MSKRKLMIFENVDFGEIRTIKNDGEPWFCGKDVAKALGYNNASDAIYKHVDDEDKMFIMLKRTDMQNGDVKRGKTKTVFVNESGLYALIFGSKLESAKKFKHWITSDVIPSIRKHGVYATDDFIELSLNNPDYAIKLLTQLKEERHKRKQAEIKIEQQKPFVEFANKVSDSSNLISVGTMSKLLKDEHINIGRNRLFKWLRDNNILMDNNIPYQKYISDGYFKVVESVYETPYGTQTQQTTFVTGKGQIYIVERLRKEWNK